MKLHLVHDAVSLILSPLLNLDADFADGDPDIMMMVACFFDLEFARPLLLIASLLCSFTRGEVTDTSFGILVPRVRH